MNQENLRKVLENYRTNLALINNDTHEEYFKWQAVQRFQKVWATDLPFAEKFKKATSECAVLLNNGHVSPLSGILKMAECEPQEVKHLFEDVLYADDGNDLELRQNHMDAFLDGIETIRQKHFPQFWKYRHDRRIASIYLTLFAPEENYIYKYTAAEDFATYTEFGFDIGSGETFSLSTYYKLCDLLVEALREDTALIEEQLEFRKDFYPDENLHLLAFDVMYCAKTYGLYKGISSHSKRESVRLQQAAVKEAQMEQERLANIESCMGKIQELQQNNDVFHSISLLNVQVHHKQYGIGVIIEQTGTNVTVQFQEKSTQFTINKKFPARPKFENDEEIVEIFTQYDNCMEQIEQLKKELAQLAG